MNYKVLTDTGEMLSLPDCTSMDVDAGGNLTVWRGEKRAALFACGRWCRVMPEEPHA